MALMFLGGKLLFRNRTVATSPDCCCLPPLCVPGTRLGIIIGDPLGTIRFLDGVPAGWVRVRYLRGAMKYGEGQNWAVNAVENVAHWAMTTGHDAPGLYDITSFATQAECEAANAGLETTVNFPSGGRFEISLLDSFYADNVAGDPAPTWELFCAAPPG